jgi:hypothetical protein
MTEKCLVCGERAVPHVNGFDRLCTVCGIVSIGDRPSPVTFMGDPEDILDALLGTVERRYEPDLHGMREKK